MRCQTCDHLFAAYKHTVNLYTQAIEEMGGLNGDAFRLALKELERLKAKSQDANEALMAHWRQDHVESKAASS
jgi:hypothetical protein